MPSSRATSVRHSPHWADQMVGLIEHRLSEEDFAAALRPFVVERPE
jgi:hypothetical protein